MVFLFAFRTRKSLTSLMRQSVMESRFSTCTTREGLSLPLNTWMGSLPSSFLMSLSARCSWGGTHMVYDLASSCALPMDSWLSALKPKVCVKVLWSPFLSIAYSNCSFTSQIYPGIDSKQYLTTFFLQENYLQVRFFYCYSHSIISSEISYHS